MAKPKALCITTKYRTLGELIERMHAFCDDASMFVATSTLLRVGERRTFALRYADRSVAIEGFCVVLHAWSSGGNPFGKPGLLLSLEQLTIESQCVFDALAARRREVARAHPARSHARGRTSNRAATGDPSTVRLAPRPPVSNSTAPLAIVARAPARGISITAEVAAAVLPGGIAEHSSVTVVERMPQAGEHRGARLATRRARTTMPARPRPQVSGGRTSGIRPEASTCQTSPLPRLGGRRGLPLPAPDASIVQAQPVQSIAASLAALTDAAVAAETEAALDAAIAAASIDLAADDAGLPDAAAGELTASDALGERAGAVTSDASLVAALDAATDDELGVAAQGEELDDGMDGMLADDFARGTVDMDVPPRPYVVVRDGFDDGSIPLDELSSPDSVEIALDIRHPRAVQWSVVFATVSAILTLAMAVAILR